MLDFKEENPVIRDMCGWAWNCGALPLAALYKIVNSPRINEENRRIVTKKVERILQSRQNETLGEQYRLVHGLFESIKQEARIEVTLPKTLPALRRDPYAFQKIERCLYREFLRFGVSVAETMTFAFKLGIWQFVDKEELTQPVEEKEELMKAYAEAARRAELDFSPFSPTISQFLDGEIDATEMMDILAERFYKIISPSENFIRRLWDAILLEPNLSGIGIDLKKLSRPTDFR